MDFLFGVVPGVLIGVLMWRSYLRPGQLEEHERQRRRAGLPSERKLPEDEGNL